jgi:hypothetical protein
MRLGRWLLGLELGLLVVGRLLHLERYRSATAHQLTVLLLEHLTPTGHRVRLARAACSPGRRPAQEHLERPVVLIVVLRNRGADGGLSCHVHFHVAGARRELHLLADIVIAHVRSDDRERARARVVENRERGQSLRELLRDLAEQPRVHAGLGELLGAYETGLEEPRSILEELALSHQPELEDRLLCSRLRSLRMDQHLVVETGRYPPLDYEAIQDRDAANFRRLFWLSPPLHSPYSVAEENPLSPLRGRKSTNRQGTRACYSLAQ